MRRFILSLSAASLTVLLSGCPNNNQVVLPPPGSTLIQSTIFLANRTAASITSYPIAATGNVAPSAQISGGSTGLSEPFGIAIAGGGSIYVANENIHSVTVYSGGSNGNAVPTATISGGSTGLHTPLGVFVDAGGKIYVVN